MRQHSDAGQYLCPQPRTRKGLRLILNCEKKRGDLSEMQADRCRIGCCDADRAGYIGFDRLVERGSGIDNEALPYRRIAKRLGLCKIALSLWRVSRLSADKRQTLSAARP